MTKNQFLNNVDMILFKNPLFYIDCSVGHRDLHSFPTRRSSDLGRGSVGGQDKRERRAAGMAGGWKRRGVEDEPIAFVDRKSTRLNSSHVRISYAVFCLKKKQGIPARQELYWRALVLDHYTVRHL